jgi:hypothetical protein
MSLKHLNLSFFILNGCFMRILICSKSIQNIAGATKPHLPLTHRLTEKEGGFQLAVFKFGTFPSALVSLRCLVLLYASLKCAENCSIEFIKAD